MKETSEADWRDDERLDGGILERLGFQHDDEIGGHYLYIEVRGLGIPLVHDDESDEWSYGEMALPNIRTRGHLCRLCAALGVDLQVKGAK